MAYNVFLWCAAQIWVFREPRAAGAQNNRNRRRLFKLGTWLAMDSGRKCVDDGIYLVICESLLCQIGRNCDFMLIWLEFDEFVRCVLPLRGIRDSSHFISPLICGKFSLSTYIHSGGLMAPHQIVSMILHIYFMWRAPPKIIINAMSPNQSELFALSVCHFRSGRRGRERREVYDENCSIHRFPASLSRPFRPNQAVNCANWTHYIRQYNADEGEVSEFL